MWVEWILLKQQAYDKRNYHIKLDGKLSGTYYRWLDNEYVEKDVAIQVSMEFLEAGANINMKTEIYRLYLPHKYFADSIINTC